uniref:Uncharacterized protein n=1 Tax=Anguilla anguilla TaxID=7936 RepID=A0A0E9X9X6_ANGAN
MCWNIFFYKIRSLSRDVDGSFNIATSFKERFQGKF